MACGGKMLDVDEELNDIMENMSIGMLKHIFRSPELKVQVGFSISLPSSVFMIVADYQKSSLKAASRQQSIVNIIIDSR